MAIREYEFTALIVSGDIEAWRTLSGNKCEFSKEKEFVVTRDRDSFLLLLDADTFMKLSNDDFLFRYLTIMEEISKQITKHSTIQIGFSASDVRNGELGQVPEKVLRKIKRMQLIISEIGKGNTGDWTQRNNYGFSRI